MKILLTGCAGFIGSHTAERLLASGHEVIGVDNFSKFYDRKIKKRNMEGFVNHPNFSFHELDIRDKDAIYSALNQSVDLVLHLAAKAGVRPSIINPIDYIDVNIKGTQHLLQWMVDHQCKKLFFASSSSVYGNNKLGTALSENKLDVEPISPYAFTKRSAELVNHTYHYLYDIDIINARFFTVYGPRQRPDLAIHKFVDLIYKKQSIEMYGDGSTARDYTYIDDTVSGIISGVDYLLENDKVYETLNLGNQNPVQLKALIKVIYDAMDCAPEIIQKGMQDGDVNITYANIEKANALLGYKPEVSINEGVKRFVEWYKKLQSTKG